MNLPANLNLAPSLNELFDNLDIAICIFDPEGEAQGWNRTFQHFFPDTVDCLEKGQSYEETLQQLYDANLAEDRPRGREDYLVQMIDKYSTVNVSQIFQLSDGRWFKTATHALSQGYRLKYWQNITAQQQLNNEIRQLSAVDGLTGIYNHRFFMERAVDMLKLARRHDRSMSVIMLDIDQLHKINESFGYPAGDEVLRQTARLLRQVLRTTDIIARLGGEEFVVILPETDLTGAIDIAERLRSKLAKLAITMNNDTIRFSASIGVAQCNPQSASIYRCLNRAEQALYIAKDKGVNRLHALPFAE